MARLRGPVNDSLPLEVARAFRLIDDLQDANVEQPTAGPGPGDLVALSQAEKRAAESMAAAEAAKSSGLPALTGSEKQVAWAETIRATAAQSLNAIRPMLQAAPEANRKAADIAIGIIDATLARTSAHDWIESRATSYDRAWLSAQTKKAMEA